MLGTFLKESYEYHAGWKGKERKALKRSQVMEEKYIMKSGIIRNPNTEISFLDNCLLNSFQVFSFKYLIGILDTSGCGGAQQKY